MTIMTTMTIMITMTIMTKMMIMTTVMIFNYCWDLASKSARVDPRQEARQMTRAINFISKVIIVVLVRISSPAVFRSFRPICHNVHCLSARESDKHIFSMSCNLKCLFSDHSSLQPLTWYSQLVFDIWTGTDKNDTLPGKNHQ